MLLGRPFASLKVTAGTALVLLPLLGLATPAGAVTYQVGPSRPYANLQAVAGLLGPGDLVEVDGNVTYPGGVVFDNAGTAAQKITLRGLRVAGQRPRVHGGADGLKLNADHYVMEGFEVTGDAGLPTNRCVFTVGNDITIRDTVVHDCPRHGILGADQFSGDLLLEHVEVHHCGSGTQYHQVYVATDNTRFPNAVFRMRFSWIHDANGGNSVKSRAGRSEIHYNWIEGALYHELDLIGADPGGQPSVPLREDHEVAGNVLVKVNTSSGRIARLGGDGTGDSNGRFRFAHNTMILGTATSAALAIQDHVESLEFSDNVVWRTDGGTFRAVRTVEQVGTSLHAGQNNWIQSNATDVRGEWTGTLLGTTPGFTNFASWNLVPAVGGALHNAGLVPTAGPGGAPFPGPLGTPAWHPPVRSVGLPGSQQARPVAGTIDIGAYESATVPVELQSLSIED